MRIGGSTQSNSLVRDVRPQSVSGREASPSGAQHSRHTTPGDAGARRRGSEYAVTRPVRTDRELELVRRFVVARGLEVDPASLHAGVHGIEPDVVGVDAGGADFLVEVGDIRDEDVARGDSFKTTEEPRLRSLLVTRAAQRGIDVRGLLVSVGFGEDVSRKERDAAIDAVLDHVHRLGLPTESVDVEPRSPGVQLLAAKAYGDDLDAMMQVVGATAFFPPLRALVEEKAKKTYAASGRVVLLAVVPKDQRWPDFLIGSAIEHLQEYLAEQRVPFCEINVFDEASGSVLFTWRPNGAAREPSAS